MKKLLCLLLGILLLTMAGCAVEEEFLEEEFMDMDVLQTTASKPVTATTYGDAIALMMKTFDNSFTQEELKQMFPKQCWTYFAEEKGKSPEEIYTDFSGRMAEVWENAAAEVGEGAAVKYELLDRTDYEGQDYQEMVTKLEEKYNIDPETIGICYEVLLKKATMGKLREDINTQRLHVFEMDGCWYVYEVLVDMPVIQ